MKRGFIDPILLTIIGAGLVTAIGFGYSVYENYQKSRFGAATITANFPTTLNSWSDGDVIEDEDIEALEAKIGINNSSVTTSLDWLLKAPTSSDPGHVHTSAAVSGTIAIAKGGRGTSTVPTNNQIEISNGTNFVQATLPDCGNATTSKLIYTTSTKTFSCATDVDTDTGGTLLISRNTTTTSFINSSAELTIASSSIPGGTLSTSNGVHMRVSIRALMGNGAPGTLTIRLTYGGQNLATSSRAYTALATERGGWLDAYVFAVGSTTVQKGFFGMDLEVGGDSTDVSGFHTWRDFADQNATSSVNSASAQTMAITWQYETANAANTVTSTMSFVEKMAVSL